MFTREWVSLIEGQGPQAAAEKLDSIRTKVIAAYVQLQGIIGRKPYYRADISDIVGDRGEMGELVGALNGYLDPSTDAEETNRGPNQIGHRAGGSQF
jgi:hypothetical protein